MSKTILMIHGFGAAGESWAPVAARFKAAGYGVETPTIHATLRTVGPPPAGLIGKTLANYVTEMSDLAQSIAKRDGEKPLVFGHSMGGLIAQKLAEAGLVSGIVLFAPASPADARSAPKLAPMFTFLNIAMTSSPETKAVKIWKMGFNWGVLNRTPPERHEAIFATTVHDSGRALSDLAYPDRDPNKTVSIDSAKITAPVLILAGARDRTTPIGDLRLVGKKYGGATFKEYPDNAHWLIDEPGSDKILADVDAWLDARGLGAQAPVTRAPVTKAPVTKAAPAAKLAKAEPAVTPAPAAKPLEPLEPAPRAKAAPQAKPVSAPAPAPAPAPPAPAPAAKASLKAPAKAKSVAKPAPAPASPPVAKTPPPAKPAPKAPAKLAASPVPTPDMTAKPTPAAKPKAGAKPAAAPAVTKAPARAGAPKPVAKPKAAALAKAPAPVKAAAKPKVPATKATAKSSPAPKKSV